MPKNGEKNLWKPQVRMGVRSLDLLGAQASTPFHAKGEIHFAFRSTKNFERSYIYPKSNKDDSFFSVFLPSTDTNQSNSKRYNRYSNSIKTFFTSHNASASKKSNKSNRRRWNLNLKQQKRKDLDERIEKDCDREQKWMVERIENFQEQCSDLTRNLEFALHNDNVERNKCKCCENHPRMQEKFDHKLKLQVELQSNEIERLGSEIDRMKFALNTVLSRFGYPFDESFLGLASSNATSFFLADDPRNSPNQHIETSDDSIYLPEEPKVEQLMEYGARADLAGQHRHKSKFSELLMKRSFLISSIYEPNVPHQMDII